MSSNGDAVVLPAGTIRGLANYPRGRLAPATNVRTLYVSGTSSRQPNGSFDGARVNDDGSLEFDAREQTSVILRHIEEVLQHATNGRGGLQNVIDATVFLIDMQKHYSGMNAAWNEVWSNFEDAPARAATGVQELPSKEMVVEIKCIATVEMIN